MCTKVTPFVSVIIPCYNTGRFLPMVLTSLGDQTYTALEVICLDDCSTDDTFSVLKQYAKKDRRISVYQNPQNLGVVGTLNQLINYASGDLILRMDSDDFFENNRISEMVGMHVQYGYDIVSTDYRVIDLQNRFITNKGLVLPTLSESIRYMGMFNSPLPSQALFRKSLFQQEKFSEKYQVAEDYYLFTRFLSHTHIKAYNIPEKLYRYRMNPNGLSTTNSILIKECHIDIARSYIHQLLGIDAHYFTFWYLAKKMVDYSEYSSPELLKDLKDVIKLRKLFTTSIKVSPQEKNEILGYERQYLLYLVFCALRDAKEQGYLRRVLPGILQFTRDNPSLLLNVKQLMWIRKNL